MHEVARRHVQGEEQAAEREQGDAVDEPRAQGRRASAQPRPDDGERREDDRERLVGEEADGGHQAQQPALQQRAQALGEERADGGRAGDAEELVVGRDPQDAAGGGRRERRAEDGDLAQVPRPHHHGEGHGTADGRRPPDATRRDDPAARAPRPPAFDEEGQAERDAQQDPVVAGQAGQADHQATGHERAAVAGQPAAAEPQGERPQEEVEAEVVRLRHVRGHGAGHGDEGAAHEGLPALEPGIQADEVGQRRGGRAGQPERQAGGQPGGPEQPDERHLDERRERQPVGVGGYRKEGYGRDMTTHLQVGPHERDVQAMARRELAGDVHVVEGVQVAGTHEEQAGRGADGQRGRE